MDLTDFVKTILVSVNHAVDEARKESNRDIHFTYSNNSRTVEFDIAVSAEEKHGASGTAGVKVLEFVNTGGQISKETSNSTVSRVKFGVDIERRTHEEEERWQREYSAIPDAFFPNQGVPEA